MVLQANDGGTGHIRLDRLFDLQSHATADPSTTDLDLLVNRARARNRSLDVTGMLLFEDGCFLQTLEGPPDALGALWSSIKQDDRHNQIEVLSEHLVSARLFSDWDLLLDGRFDETQRRARLQHRLRPPSPHMSSAWWNWRSMPMISP